MQAYIGIFKENEHDLATSSDDDNYKSAPQSPTFRLPSRCSEHAASTIDNQCASLKWIVVASASHDDMNNDELAKFGKWYSENFNRQVTGRNPAFQLCEEPIEFLRTEPSNKSSYEKVYESIHNKHPNVFFVVQILPHNKMNPSITDKDHTWMKGLSLLYAIVTQGIKLENALLKSFPGNTVEAAFNRMLSYVSHSIHEMALSKCSPEKRSIFEVRINIPNNYCKEVKTAISTLCIQEDKENTDGFKKFMNQPPSVTFVHKKYLLDNDINYAVHTNDQTEAVWRALHKYTPWHSFRLFADPHHGYDDAHCRTDAWLTMRGIPENIRSVFRIGAHFADYDVRNVFFAEPENDIERHEMNINKSRTAHICLGSRWQVVHAVENLKKKLVDEYHVTLQAYHPRAIDAINTAVKYDAKHSIYQKYSDQAIFKRERNATSRY